jgi:hypothetical protein
MDEEEWLLMLRHPTFIAEEWRQQVPPEMLVKIY